MIISRPLQLINKRNRIDEQLPHLDVQQPDLAECLAKLSLASEVDLEKNPQIAAMGNIPGDSE